MGACTAVAVRIGERVRGAALPAQPAGKMGVTVPRIEEQGHHGCRWNREKSQG